MRYVIMILLDLSQIMYSNILAVAGKTDLTEDLLRHMLLNTIRANYVKFKNQYGKLVIAADGSNNWRKKVFPYYKANRAKNRSTIVDWSKIFATMAKLREELKENFPYPLVCLDEAE